MALQSLATDTCKQRGKTLDKDNDIKHVANKVTSGIILIIIQHNPAKFQRCLIITNNYLNVALSLSIGQ